MAVIAKFVSILNRIAQILGTLFNTSILTYLVVGLSRRNILYSRALAVEIMSAAGLVWATFVMIFTICLLQKTAFQWFTTIGDILFMGANIAIAIMLRYAFRFPCSSNNLSVNWLQRGGPNLGANCQLVRGVFVVAIVLAVSFFVSAIISWAAHSSAKKDKAFGPSPANNYTSGRGRKNKRDTEAAAGLAATGPALVPPTHDGRHSHESKYTDVTEKTNDGFNGHNPTATTAAGGPGREYLAPRATAYPPTETTVSPVPSSTNLPYRGTKESSHAGQYAMAGALVGGAAAHHHHNKNQHHHDGLPNHPGPEDHTTERVYNPEADSYVSQQQPAHLAAPSAAAYGGYGTNTNSTYSELDNTTTTGSVYNTPGAYPGSHGHFPPTAFYPAENPTELPPNSAVSNSNPHYYSSEMDATPVTAGGDREYRDYQTNGTPIADRRREEEGFGYGSGPGMTGGGGNQVSTLPEMGREDARRF